MLKYKIFVLMTVIITNFSYSQVCNGDSNNDSMVNVLDIITTVSHILENITLNGDSFNNTDVNNDNNINILDVISITNLILDGVTDCVEPDIGLDLSLDWLTQDDLSYFDYESLDATLSQLQNFSSLHGIIILHEGKIVGEQYSNQGGVDITFNIWSVTKSYISTLIGQTIDQGYLPNPNTTLNNIFSNDYGQDYLNNITLNNVLTMTTGYYDSFVYPYWVQQSTENLVNMPYLYPNYFFYNNSACHLTSHLLYESTGLTPIEFAQENLFPYLGIENPFWLSGYNGINDGSASLYLTLREMIKLGQLYLQDGYSGNEQILSSNYIQDATTFQIDTGGFGYGYLWWLANDINAYLAIGFGGQIIAVFPDLDLVIGTNSYTFSSQDYQNDLYYYVLYVIPSFFN